MTDLTCSLKWNKIPKQYATLKEGILSTTTYSELVEFVKNLLKDSENGNLENDLEITKDDVVYLLGRLKSELTSMESEMAPLIANIDLILSNLNTILAPSRNKVIEDKKASLNLSLRSQLIPILSPKLNGQLAQEFSRDLFSVLIYDHKEIKNPKDLDSSIQDYKTALFKKLCNYFGITYTAIYDLQGQFDSDTYNSIMTNIWNEINNKVLNESIDGIYDKKNPEFIDAVKAFYILNNFDEFISTFSNGTIVVDRDQFGTVEITSGEGGKYQFIAQSKGNSNHREGFDTVDADKTFSKIFNEYWGSTEYLPGRYLTKRMFEKLCRVILYKYQDSLNHDFDFLGDELTTDTLLTKIAEALQKNRNFFAAQISNKYGYEIIDAIIAECQNYKTAYKDAISELESADEIREFDIKLNFGDALRNEIATRLNIQYVKHTETGLASTTPATIKGSKRFIVEALRNSLKTHLLQYSFADYAPEFLSDSLSKALYSMDFLNYINRITGLSLNESELSKLLLDEERLTDLARYLQTVIRVANTYLIPRYRSLNRHRSSSNARSFEDELESLLDEAVNLITNDNNYKDYAGKFIEDNDDSLLKVLDLSGNAQPTSANPNTGQRTKENILSFGQLFEKVMGRKPVLNILFKFPQLLSPNHDQLYETSIPIGYFDHIGYRQDMKVKDSTGKEVIIPANLMNPLDMVDMSFNDEFFESVVKNGIFWNQLSCYSDKTRILLGAFNLNAKLQRGGDKTFLLLPSSEIKKIWKALHDEYYNALKELIRNDYVKIFSGIRGSNITETSTLEECIAFLETLNFDKFLKAYTDYNRTHQNDQVNIIENIHYISEKGSKLLKFNNTLYAEISGRYQNEYYNAGLAEFKGYLKSIKIPERFRSQQFIDSHVDSLTKLFGLSQTTENMKLLYSFFGLVENSTATGWEHSKQDVYWILDNSLSNELILKYFALSNVCSDADMMITAKPDFSHKSKQKQLSISDMTNPDNNWMELLIADRSNRYVTSTKRNNSIVATFIPMRSGNKFLVAKLMRVAVVDSYSQNLRNYNGLTHSQAVHDGGAWTIGTAARWEEASYPMLSYKGTKKVIGFHQSLGAMHLVKLADYVIDNHFLAQVFEENDNWANWLTRVKQMMSPAVFGDGFYKAFSVNSKVQKFNLNPIYKNINGTIYGLTEIAYDENTDTLTFTWEDLTQLQEGQSSKNPVVNTIVSAKANSFNAYDLWVALGALDSLSREDGEYIRSNASMDNVADIISLYDPDLKTKMISKILDKECVKSGIVSINTLELLDGDNDGFLNTVLFDTSRWGIQLDYSHESDESHITSLTLVMSAVAFNGKNIKLVEDLYDTVATLVKLEMVKLDINWANKAEADRLHHLLARELLKSLLTQLSISDAENIALRVLDNYGTLMQYSLPEVFYKLSSNIISSLNSDAIRQKFHGIAIIQNPSLGIIGLYEDNQGNVYTKDDLIEIGRKILITPEGQNITDYNAQFTNQQYIAAAIKDPRFAPLEISGVDELELEDWYSYDGVTKRIVEPQLLFDLQTKITDDQKGGKNIKLFKVFGKLRDLRVPQVLFKLNGVTKSFWLSDAVQWRLNAKTFTELLQALDFYRKTIEALSRTSNPVYLHRVYNEDTKSYIIEEIPVTDVTYTSGEQILPKVNKTAHNIGNKTLAKLLSRGSAYFESELKTLLLPESILGNLDKGNLGANEEYNTIMGSRNYLVTVVQNNAEINYTDSIENIPEVLKYSELSNRIIEESGQCWAVDKFGKKLFTVPSRDSRVYQHLDKLVNGKEEYLVIDPLGSDGKTVLNKALLAGNNTLTIFETTQKDNIVANSTFEKFSKYLSTKVGRQSPDIEVLIKAIAINKSRSVELSNYTISARIPSQSFQSYMANKTVAFNLKDINDGYINIWLMWFLGSDFDIDKEYTMMYALDKLGIVETTSPLSNLKSITTLTASFRLPLPKSDKTIKSSKENSTIESILDPYLRTVYPIDPERPYSYAAADLWVADLLTAKDEIANLKGLTIMKHVLELINSSNVELTGLGAIVNRINTHLMYSPTKNGYKNRILNILHTCSRDLRNMEASTLPMDSEYINNLILECEDELGVSTKKTYIITSPVAKYLMQYENSVGKGNVGIAANAVKADAALQLHMNKVYKEWDGKTPLSSRYRMNMPIEIYRANGEAITAKSYVKLGNTVLDENEEIAKLKFISLYDDVPTELLANETEYKLLTTVLLSSPTHSFPDTDQYYYTNSKGERVEKTQYKELESQYKLFISANPMTSIMTREGYLDFLFFRTKFEHNVADNLSIFISLATDNAKELALARINANPQLMSMPLAMLTLGMEPKHVIDICVNVLAPLAQKMQGDHFLEDVETDVHKLIQIVLEEGGFGNPDSDLAQATAISLQRIYSFAQELRVLTSFFKINLGVSAQYIELLQFIRGLSKSKTRLELYSLVSKADKDLVHKLASGDLDVELLFDALDKSGKRLLYVNNLILAYDYMKTGFNVIDIIVNNPNFNSMLEAMVQELLFLKQISAAARFIDTATLTSNRVYNSNELRKLLEVYRHFITQRALEKLTDILFTKESIEASLGIKLNNSSIGNKVFSLDTKVGIDLFMETMTDYIIPKLKLLYSDNYFMESISAQPDSKTGKTVYRMDYDIWNSEDTAQLAMILDALADLREIHMRPSGLKTVSGGSLTIGEALYLYNLIANKNVMSSMTKCITTVLNESNSRIPKIVLDTYLEYDKKSNNIIEVSRDNLEVGKLYAVERLTPDLSKTLYPIVTFNTYEEIDNFRKANPTIRIYTTVDGSSDFSLLLDFSNLRLVLAAALERSKEVRGSKMVSLKDEFIWTLAPVTSGCQLKNLKELGDVKISFENYNPESRLLVVMITVNTPLYPINIKRVLTVPKSITDPEKISVNMADFKALYTTVLHYLTNSTDMYGSTNYKEVNFLKDIVDTFIGDAHPVVSKVLRSFGDLRVRTRVTNSENTLQFSRNGFVSALGGDKPIIILDKVLADNNAYLEFELVDLTVLQALYTEGEFSTSADKINYLKSHLDSIEDLTKELKKRILNNYTSYLVLAYPGSEIVQYCLDKITLLSPYMGEDKMIYYQDMALDSVITNKNVRTLLQLGDLVAIKGEAYTYVGEVNNEDLFVSVDGSIHKLSSEDRPVLKQRLKVLIGYSIPRVSSFKVSSEFTPITSVNELRPGDKVRIKGSNKVFTFRDIVYRKEGETFHPEIIVSENNLLSILSNSSAITEVAKVVQAKTDSSKSQSLSVKINPAFLGTALEYSKQLYKGDKIVLSTGEEGQFIRRINDSTFEVLVSNTDGTKTSKVVKLNEVREFTPTIISCNDRDFILNTTPYRLRGNQFISKYDTNGKDLAAILANSLNAKLITPIITYGPHSALEESSLNFVDSYEEDLGSAYFVREKQFVYRLQNYSQIYSPAYSKGDIMIKRSTGIEGSDEFYKIHDIKHINEKTVYEVYSYSAQTIKGYITLYITDWDNLYDSDTPFYANRPNEDFEILYWTESDLLGLKWDHYTQNAANLEGEFEAEFLPEESSVTDIQKSDKILEFIKDKLHMKVELRENLGVRALVHNNTIYFDASLQEDQLVSESIHELSHLVLAYMRLNSPEAYMELVEKFNKYADSSLDEETLELIRKISEEVLSNSSTYMNEVDQMDEIMIRYFDATRTVDFAGKADKEIPTIINLAFQKFFNTIGFSDELIDSSVGSVLENYLEQGIFTKMVDNLSLALIKKSERFKDLLSKVKRYCN